MQSKHNQSTTERELIKLSRRVIELLNARAYDDPWFRTYVAPDVMIDFNGQRVGTGLKDFIGFYRMDADRSPTFICDVDVLTALVSESMGTATVILTQVLSGFQDSLMTGKKRAASILWSWRMKEKGWELQGVCMLFGTPEFLV